MPPRTFEDLPEVPDKKGQVDSIILNAFDIRDANVKLHFVTVGCQKPVPHIHSWMSNLLHTKLYKKKPTSIILDVSSDMWCTVYFEGLSLSQ